METALALLLKYKYAVLFPLAAFEGPVISLVVGFLVHAGTFNFLIAYGILILGDLIPDTIFYCIGYYGNQTKVAQKYFAKSKFFREHFTVIEKLWKEHGRKTMFFGKLAYGLALPFLVSAGMAKMPYKKFISYAVPITLFQYGVIMGIGYGLGSSYALASGYIKYAYFGIAVLVAIFILAYIFLTKYARRKIIAMEQDGEAAEGTQEKN
ncbi:MAG: hypothetical protein JWO73_524 [Candidatus Taylorbacteria bacterium]|nr:hypothetical protein [Candidatus Taylorbacteria bacterium]